MIAKKTPKNSKSSEGNKRKPRAVVLNISHNSCHFFLLNPLSPEWCLLSIPLLLLKFRSSKSLDATILPISYLASSHHRLLASAPNLSPAAKKRVLVRHKSNHVMSLLSSSMAPTASNVQFHHLCMESNPTHPFQGFPCRLQLVGPGKY